MNKKIINGIALTTMCVSFGNLKSFPQEIQKPNIIWLMAEDIGSDLACYGMKAVKTPNLDKLAETGIKFTNCFCTNPICSPSRSAMMIGVNQIKINAQHHRSNRDVPLPEPYKPFTYWLRQAGYTCVLGSELVMDKGRKIDCNFKYDPLGLWDGKDNFGLFDKYDEILPEDQPFFAQIQLKVTHRGDWWNETREKSPHPVNPDSVELPPYFADHPDIRLDWARYLDQEEYMDNEVGEIIRYLKNKGIYKNTVIIFIGDNGRCNIRGKGYLHDPGLRIPLIVNWPDSIGGGQVRDDIISTTDITAAILGLAGVKIPAYMTGGSFLQKSFHRDYAFAARDLWDEVPEKSRSIYTKQYAYILNEMPQVPWDAHQTYLEFYRPAVHVMRKLMWEGKLNDEQKFFFSPTKPREELYDLRKDPHQLVNLADKPEYKEILEKMRAAIRQEEIRMAPADTVFHPVFPDAVNILEWVKYIYPDEYLRMLNGTEIGFRKYSQLYFEEMKKQNKSWLLPQD